MILVKDFWDYTIFLPLRIQIRKRSTDIKKNHKISPKSLKIVIVIFFPPNKQQLHWKLIELDLTFHLLVLLLSQGSFEKMFCVIPDDITLHSSDAPWSNQSQCPMLHSADRKPRDNHRSPLVSHAADNRTHNFSFVLFLKIRASSETFHLVFQLFLDFTIICVYVMLCMCVCVFTCLCVCEGTCVCVYLSVHVCWECIHVCAFLYVCLCVCWCTCVSAWACMYACVHMYISVMADVSVTHHALRSWRRISGADLLFCGRHDPSSVPRTLG